MALSNGIVADRDRTAASINVAISASLSNKVTPSDPRKWISTLKDAGLLQQQFKAIAAWKFVEGYQFIYDTAQKDGKHRKSTITALAIGGQQAIEVLSPWQHTVIPIFAQQQLMHSRNLRWNAVRNLRHLI